MFNLTPQEKKVFLFLLLALLMGGIIHLYRMNFPRELISPAEQDSIITLFQKGTLQTNQLEDSLSNSRVSSSAHQKININSASLEELTKLPHVGISTARKIIEYREEHGNFRTVEELINVKGIGPKTLEKIREEITLE